jgi:hypothetical protein
LIVSGINFPLAILHDAEKSGTIHESGNPDENEDHDQESDSRESGSVQDTIRRISGAVAPVILPIIDQLSGLSEEDLTELSMAGEDA